jgi:hypothetical protein
MTSVGDGMSGDAVGGGVIVGVAGATSAVEPTCSPDAIDAVVRGIVAVAGIGVADARTG